MGAIRFSSIGSGSKGNAMLVESAGTRVMLDCGFGLRETLSRLSLRGITPDSLDGVLVTHEHGDHVGGVEKLAKRYNLRVYLTYGTFLALSPEFEHLDVFIIENFKEFKVGGLSIKPFPVPHDAREPAQFIFSSGKYRIGVLTDVGKTTSHIETVLSGCDALVIEFNYDEQMMLKSNYPINLRRRISGPLGHLSNNAAEGILGSIDQNRLQYVVAAHLSQNNNTVALVEKALTRSLKVKSTWAGIADQHKGFDWCALSFQRHQSLLT